MFRKAMVCALVVLLTTSLIGVSLSEGNSFSPRYTYTAAVDAGLSISGGVATATGSIIPHNLQETMVYVRLQQQVSGEWKTIQTWIGHNNSGFSDAGGTKSVTSGYYYRTRVTGYVYDENGNVLESVSMSSTPKPCGTVTP